MAMLSSLSSNMSAAARQAIHEDLSPALRRPRGCFARKALEFDDVVKIGRTHRAARRGLWLSPAAHHGPSSSRSRPHIGDGVRGRRLPLGPEGAPRL